MHISIDNLSSYNEWTLYIYARIQNNGTGWMDGITFAKNYEIALYGNTYHVYNTSSGYNYSVGYNENWSYLMYIIKYKAGHYILNIQDWKLNEIGTQELDADLPDTINIGDDHSSRNAFIYLGEVFFINTTEIYNDYYMEKHFDPYVKYTDKNGYNYGN